MYDDSDSEKEHWESIRYRGGKPNEVFLEIGNKELCSLFKISRTTLWRWIKSKKLDPTNIESIIQLYNRLNILK